MNKIDNFSLKELENILNLKNNYTIKDVNKNYDLIISKIIENKETIDKFIFIKNAKQKILNYLIQKPYLNKFPLNVNNKTYETGIINPLDNKIIENSITIDSFYRNNPEKSYTNDFLIIFNEPLKNVISYEVNSIELPNMWFIISELRKNNTFTIIVHNYNDGSGNIISSTRHDIVLEDGNYSINELERSINNYFNNIKQGLDFLLFKINTINAKSIIRVKTEYDVQYLDYPKPFYGDLSSNDFYSPDFYFELDFDLIEDQEIRKQQNYILNSKPICTYYDSNNKLHKSCNNYIKCDCTNDEIRIINTNIRDYKKNFGFFLGFTESYYKIDASYTFIDYFNDDTSTIYYKCYLESENNFGDSVDKYILLYIDDFNKNKKIAFNFANNNNIGNNIIAKIPVTSPSYTIINQNSADKIYRKCDFFGPVDIYKLNIKILNRNGELVDLRKNNFSFSLLVKQIYS